MNINKINANLQRMTRKDNNWLNYILVFALMLLPLQNSMAMITSVASAPAETRQVCHEMASHSQSQAGQTDMQQHANSCCDKDMNCQQQCTDCLHCPAVSAVTSAIPAFDVYGKTPLNSAFNTIPDTVSFAQQFRPPRV